MVEVYFIVKANQHNVWRSLYYTPVLFWHPDYNLPDGLSACHRKYITGLVLGWTPEIHADISQFLNKFYMGQKCKI